MDIQSTTYPPSPADDIVIRAARPSDCEGVAALGNMPGYRWGTLRLPHQTPEATRKWLEGVNPTSNVSLVVEKDGQIIGSGGFERYQGRRAHVAYLGMGLHDDFHGRGIGSRLLRELIMIAVLRLMALATWDSGTISVTNERRAGLSNATVQPPQNATA